jgi:hypothetical protein
VLVNKNSFIAVFLIPRSRLVGPFDELIKHGTFYIMLSELYILGPYKEKVKGPLQNVQEDFPAAS